LEWWNAGILEKWVLGYWAVGLMDRRRWDDKIKNGQYPFNNQYSIIPQFHYSMIKEKLRSRKIFLLSTSLEIPRR
jgi:hypothetical protein